MRAGDLATTDLRPLFVQALEQAKHQNLLEGSFFQRTKEDGIKMTLNFAERYYSKFRQEDLVISFNSIVGILSLGLYFISGGNFDLMVKSITRDSLIDIFRVGWTNVIRLREIANKSRGESNAPETSFLIEKEISESLSCDPKGQWPGLTTYNKMLAKYKRMSNIRSYHLWLDKSFSVKKSQLEGKNVPSLYLSLALSEKPFAPLNYEQIEQLAHALADKKSRAIFRKNLSSFISLVPSKWRKIAAIEIARFWNNQVKEALKLVKEDRLGDFASWLIVNFLENIDASKTSQSIYEAYRRDVRGKPQERLIGMLKENPPELQDVSLRMAIVDEILSRKIVPLGTVIAILINTRKTEWQGKINWQKLPGKKILGILNHPQLIFLQEEILQDLFAQAETAPSRWWKGLPLDLINLGLTKVPTARRLIVERAVIEWKVLERKLIGKRKMIGSEIFPHYAFLIKPENWLDAWVIGSGELLLPCLLSEAKKIFGQYRPKAIKRLLEVCKTLISQYRSRMEPDLLVEPPFYVFGLEEVLVKILLPAEFKIFKKILAKQR